MSDEAASTTARVIEEASRRLTACLSDLIPPAAIGHLVKAQREVLLAVAAVVQHSVSRSATKATPTARRGSARAKKPTRVRVR